METVLILAALAACAIAGLVVLALNARSRRPPLRMDTDLHEDDAHRLLASVATPESPIDRTAPMLDGTPVEPRRDAPRIGGPAQPQGETR